MGMVYLLLIIFFIVLTSRDIAEHTKVPGWVPRRAYPSQDD